MAHSAARINLYPMLFTSSILTFEDVTSMGTEREREFDGNQAIDKIIRVKAIGFRESLTFYIQERFRRPYYRKFQDITITEWNHVTNQQGELYKIRADYLVYGYYDERTNRLLQAVAVNMPELKRRLLSNVVSSGTLRNPRSSQSAVTVKFTELRKHNLTVCEYQAKELAA
jgi:hypothetical protein